MNRQRIAFRLLPAGLVVAALFNLAPTVSASPYGSVMSIAHQLGPGIIPPKNVIGKEYSHDLDLNAAGLLDAQRVIAWDGSGGVGDGLDYTGTRPTYTLEDQVDAIANANDLYYSDLRLDRAHLLFSIDDAASARGPIVPPPPIGFIVPSAGPIGLANGQVIGGAGEISYELGSVLPSGAAPSTQGLWASQAQINDMPLPIDVDGLEVWGNEPAFTADSNKYSLRVDAASGTSVWNLSGTPYVSHAAIVSTVMTLLGPFAPGSELDVDDIDLDALMVLDVSDPINDTFDRDPMGNPSESDEILFSIKQLIDPADPTGYYATGSEIFFLNASGFEGFLVHGGHVWDKAYALSNMISLAAVAGGNLNVQHDLNALEAVADVPEPAGLMLGVFSLSFIVAKRRRRG